LIAILIALVGRTWTASSPTTRRRQSCSHREEPLRGPAAIRSLFQAIFTEFAKPGTTFSLELRSVDGDYAYILWRAETADNTYEAVADTFVMRNGQIILHSFGGKIQAKDASIQ
jgi:hypothetical protein